MRILGIDYGRSKVGLAISVNGFAEPLKVIRYKDIRILCDQIKQIIDQENIDNVVVGVSEGEMGKESKRFSLRLGQSISIPVSTFDETLTTKDAQRLSIEAGVGRKKRRGMEDAYAASLMLQNYLNLFRP